MFSDHSHFVRAAGLAEVREAGCLAANVEGRRVALFAAGESVYAVENRCPHMGFPLERGTVHDGILTCHWHHARFDLETGGTFDQWADDVRRFPVEIREGEVWVNIAQDVDLAAHHQERLLVGLERDIPLVIAKAALVLVDTPAGAELPLRTGLEFGAAFRRSGWGQGMTILTCLSNLIPYLQEDDRARALYHGLAAVARDTSGEPPRFGIWPLPGTYGDTGSLKRWLRRFIEVRDAEGAERCVVSAVANGASPEEMADMLFAAATDHRYIQTGHVLDFTNKAFEALDISGWDLAGTLLTSLVRGYASAERMEEANSWRNPVDLIALLEEAFEQLPGVVHQHSEEYYSSQAHLWPGRDELVNIVLDDSPQQTIAAMLEELERGATMLEVASAISYAAALRIARFHTSNEFGDWDTALHTFTFANAVEQGLRRSPSVELLRGVFDAAMSIYLDRFLNIPAEPLPEAEAGVTVAELLQALPGLLDRQQQVNQAGQLVASYFGNGGQAEPVMAVLGRLLLREDRDFHTIQMVEAAFQQARLLEGSPDANYVLVAAARYLAAHAPTVRSQEQTFQIARRLHQGDRLYR